ncbi:MAG: insulinase family protein [Clostridia bacterium]|nr:insulinase family protein [Clostridia bacterium]
MDTSYYAKELCDGVFFHAIPVTKFKTSHIMAAVSLPLSADTASAYSALSYIFRRSCERYPDFTLLQRHLSKLYGAELSSSTLRIGDRQIIMLSVESIDDRFTIDGEAISLECAELLREALLHPALEDGLLRAEDVDAAKRLLCERIESQRSDKRLYSFNRCIEEMFAGEPYGTDPLGTREQVEALTPEVLTARWREMLAVARIDIFAGGAIDCDAICSLFADAFASAERRYSPHSEDIIKDEALEVREVIEEADVTQCKLVIGLRSKAPRRGRDFVRSLMSCCLGGSAHSRFFLNVREKLSLCYYCSSHYNGSKGVVFIQSGLLRENVELARKEILAQIQSIANGELTDEEIAAAKLTVTDDYIGSNDSLDSTIIWYLRCAVTGEVITPEEAAERINAVTARELADAAASLSLDTVYILTGSEKEGKQ